MCVERPFYLVVFCYIIMDMTQIPITDNTYEAQNVVVHKKKPKVRGIFIAVFSVFAVIAIGFLSYQNYTLVERNEELYVALQDEHMKYEMTLLSLGSTAQELESTQEHRDQLESDLNEQLLLVDAIKQQVSDLGGTLTVLDKLSKTDEELLQKYSKVFFLNEHYRPAKLVEINPQYVYPDRDLWIHGDVQIYLENMLKSATSSGVDLLVISAFRSFDEQARLKGDYVVTYGSGANEFSADQGYSEHQLGTTVDFTTTENGVDFGEFDSTPAYQWLLDNAYKYGYVLSYPEDNDYYLFEPWHWRFVGVKLATYLHEQEMGFYDMDQRDIDDYLAVLFD